MLSQCASFVDQKHSMYTGGGKHCYGTLCEGSVWIPNSGLYMDRQAVFTVHFT
jgi:hypothetical protein